uniref:Uncharacterized protein n=1 Tax=Siphoviridae sp. ctCS019 TaxID=2825378 RepID=A0A8S5U5D1_9CAUD|nr:MAG TPA: hypothetical protein [Siphoviridae sp. ctCS019]
MFLEHIANVVCFIEYTKYFWENLPKKFTW